MRRQIGRRKRQVPQGCADGARQGDEGFVFVIFFDERYVILFVERLDTQVISSLFQTKTDTRANTLGYRYSKNAPRVGSVPFNYRCYRVAAATLTSTGIRVPGSYDRRVEYSRP